MYSYKVCSLTEVTNFTGLLSFCSSCLVTACSIGLVCEHAVSFDQLFGDCNCKVTGSSTTSPLHSIVFKCSVIECYNIQKVDLKKKMGNRKYQICRISQLILLMLSCSGQLQNKPAFSTGKGSNNS